MPEVALNALELRLQKQVESVRAALDRGQPGTAAELCAQILAEQPSCFGLRQLERTALLQLAGERPSGLSRVVRAVSVSPFLLSGSLRLKDEPRLAVASAEKVLRRDPNHVGALELLGQAAQALGWTETAVFAWSIARELEPDRTDLQLALGRALVAAGRTPGAAALAREVLRCQPGHAGAIELQREAEVTAARREWVRAGGDRSETATPFPKKKG